MVRPYEDANGTVEGIKRGTIPTGAENSDPRSAIVDLPGMELPPDLPDNYTLGDVIRDKTDSEYPDYQPHLSDEAYTFRNPLCSENLTPTLKTMMDIPMNNHTRTIKQTNSFVNRMGVRAKRIPSDVGMRLITGENR